MEAINPVLIIITCFLLMILIIPRIVRSILYGDLNPYVIRLLDYFEQSQNSRDFKRANSNNVWDREDDNKIFKLSSRSVSYKSQLDIIKYLETLPPSIKLAKYLEDAIPHQHRLDVKAKISCLLCKTLNEINHEKNENGTSTPTSGLKWKNLESVLINWLTIIVIWFALLSVFALLGEQIISLDAYLVIILWITMDNVYQKGNHVIYTSKDGNSIRIDYPMWLTYEDSSANAKKSWFI